MVFVICCAFGSAETLGDRLRTSHISTLHFARSELSQNITSYAIFEDNPFLLAYYVDDGSGQLRSPLNVVRFDRDTFDLRRAALRDINALFQNEIPMDCLGSALSVKEHRSLVYIDTHSNPSAGCVIILSSDLKLKTALSGWVIGLLGADYAIVQESEIHFMSVHPLHIQVFDIKQNRAIEVYPPQNDLWRRQFSHAIKPRISDKWCMQNNAQCDPGNFDVVLKAKAAVNEEAKTFGFEATFNASGFGDSAEKHVPPRTIAYIYREHSGIWEHREFQPEQLKGLFGAASIQELVKRKPNAAFK